MMKQDMSIEQTGRKEWYVITPRGKYVISFGERGFRGYQIEALDSAGENSLPHATVMSIANHFKLEASL